MSQLQQLTQQQQQPLTLKNLKQQLSTSESKSPVVSGEDRSPRSEMDLYSSQLEPPPPPPEEEEGEKNRNSAEEKEKDEDKKLMSKIKVCFELRISFINLQEWTHIYF